MGVESSGCATHGRSVGTTDSDDQKVLIAIVCTQELGDKSLATLFCAVEEIIKGRHITPISDDPRDLKALTPFHLLRLDPETETPVDVLSIEEAYRK